MTFIPHSLSSLTWNMVQTSSNRKTARQKSKVRLQFFNKANFKLIIWLNAHSVYRKKSSLVILERSSHTISTRTSPIKVVLTSQKAKRVCSLATNSLLMDSKDWNKLKQFNSICCCFWHFFFANSFQPLCMFLISKQDKNKLANTFSRLLPYLTSTTRRRFHESYLCIGKNFLYIFIRNNAKFPERPNVMLQRKQQLLITQIFLLSIQVVRNISNTTVKK